LTVGEQTVVEPDSQISYAWEPPPLRPTFDFASAFVAQNVARTDKNYSKRLLQYCAKFLVVW